jgi:hypothetical protein
VVIVQIKITPISPLISWVQVLSHALGSSLMFSDSFANARQSGISPGKSSMVAFLIKPLSLVRLWRLRKFRLLISRRLLLRRCRRMFPYRANRFLWRLWPGPLAESTERPARCRLESLQAAEAVNILYLPISNLSFASIRAAWVASVIEKRHTRLL